MRSYGDLAWLYDAAFSWDVGEEVEWLLGRLGEGTECVLEPACGTARLWPDLIARGVRMLGVDLSEDMLSRARERLGGQDPSRYRLVLADMGDFALEERADGAICPINSFGHLVGRDAAARHLACVARHLRPGGRYLVQLDLRNVEAFQLMAAGANTCWETPSPRGTVRCTVEGEAFDAETAVEYQRTRYEVVDGEAAGLCHEDRYGMQAWDWAAWSALVDASPFRQVAAFDGNRRDRPAVPAGPELEDAPLTWHELVLA